METDLIFYILFYSDFYSFLKLKKLNLKLNFENKKLEVKIKFKCAKVQKCHPCKSDSCNSDTPCKSNTYFYNLAYHLSKTFEILVIKDLYNKRSERTRSEYNNTFIIWIYNNTSIYLAFLNIKLITQLNGILKQRQLVQ